METAFSSSGIYPLDPAKVISKLPSRETGDNTNVLNDSVISLLTERRSWADAHEPKKKRGRKLPAAGINLAAAQISLLEVDQDPASDHDTDNSECEQQLVNDNELCGKCGKQYDNFNVEWTVCLICELWFCYSCVKHNQMYVCEKCCQL